MNIIGKTSIVFNEPNKLVGLPPFYYRYRTCDTNLNGNTPADQYQKLKLIQNTVRVYGSLYTSNLGPLNAYKKPTNATYGVCWNQMSDRPIPSVQRASIPTGFNNSLNSRHHSVTSSKPGSQTPGGVGCDIKHNSYDRYLNRLKGKGPLRRGAIPPTFGAPIPFNQAFPIYGGKTVKTNIVSGCDCPIGTPQQNFTQDLRIYNNPNWQSEPSGTYLVYTVGSHVYAKEGTNNFYTEGIITAIVEDTYTVTFVISGTTQSGYTYSELIPYFPCKCNDEIQNYSNEYLNVGIKEYNLDCYLPTDLLLGTNVL